MALYVFANIMFRIPISLDEVYKTTRVEKLQKLKYSYLNLIFELHMLEMKKMKKYLSKPILGLIKVDR